MRNLLLSLATLLLLVPPVAAQMGGSGMQNMMSGEILVPAAGRGPGADGALWRTDLWLKAPVGTAVTMEFHPNDATTDAPSATTHLTMTAPVMRLADLLKDSFGFEEAFGNIVVRGDHPVSATVRVYTVSGVGAYGSAFMGMPTTMAMSGSGGSMMGNDNYQMYVTGLLPQPRARVNAMVTNAGATSISGVVEVLDADGQPAMGGQTSFPFTLRAYSSHQFTRMLDGLTSRYGDGSGMQLRMRLADGSAGRVMMLASVIDNETNDTYTIMGNMMNAGGNGGGMMP